MDIVTRKNEANLQMTSKLDTINVKQNEQHANCESICNKSTHNTNNNNNNISHINNNGKTIINNKSISENYNQQQNTSVLQQFYDRKNVFVTGGTGKSIVFLFFFLAVSLN